MQIQRRFNYTERKRIQRSDVRIRLIEESDQPPRLTVELDLSRLQLPDDAAVFIEAYYKSSSQRFNCGTVGAFQLPEDTTLRDVDLGGQTLFRVKVVDRSVDGGRLLASAERIPPKDESEEDRDSLINVRTRDIGDQTWRVDPVSDSKPELTLNNRIPNAIGKIKHNPLFQGLVLPGVIREVLTWILWNNDEGVEDQSWQKQWLSFSEQMAGEKPKQDADPQEITEWINDVVRAFCSKHKLCERMVGHMEG